MEQKLKELTEKLYGEGLDKGRKEAEALLSSAKAEAEKILADAKAEAEVILSDAWKKAKDVEKNSLTEIALSGKAALQTLKAEIENAVVASTTDLAVDKLMLDADFVKELLLQLASAWKANQENVSIEAMLSDTMASKFDAATSSSLKELLSKGIEVGFSKKVRGGFQLKEKNGGYFISFTDESFKALISEYLKEKVRKILFA